MSEKIVFVWKMLPFIMVAVYYIVTVVTEFRWFIILVSDSL
jgi:hypothetical protein